MCVYKHMHIHNKMCCWLTSSRGPCRSWNSTMEKKAGCSFRKPKDSNRPGAALKKVKRLIWDRMTICPNRKFLGVCPSFQCPAACTSLYVK